MTDSDFTRRGFVTAIGATGMAAVAGCTAVEPPSGDAAAAGGVNPVEVGEERFVDLYDAISGSVVELRIPDAGPLGQDGGGSGFLINDGQLVTNEHVVEQRSNVEIRYRDQEWGAGTVRETDVHSDLAVVDVDDPPNYVDSLSFGSGFPQIGEEVMAIGSPFGFGGSATVGIVSGVNRSLPSPTGFSIPAAIQTDAAVNPGNSGGPLINLSGTVQGVVFAGTGENVGFAISAPLANEVVPVLREGREYQHSFMGVRLLEVTPTIAEANGLSEAVGVYVEEVMAGDPADGILAGTTGQETIDGSTVPVGGDVIVAMDDTEIGQLDALSAYLALETGPGDTIAIDLFRDGERQTVDLTLGTRPQAGVDTP